LRQNPDENTPRMPESIPSLNSWACESRSQGELQNFRLAATEIRNCNRPDDEVLSFVTNEWTAAQALHSGNGYRKNVCYFARIFDPSLVDRDGVATLACIQHVRVRNFATRSSNNAPRKSRAKTPAWMINRGHEHHGNWATKFR
jgi:hypothetical protein